MMYKFLILISLIASVLLSGCVDKTPTREELSNVQLVDSFCKSQGYEYGSTEYLRSGERWDIVDDFWNRGHVLYAGENGVLCIRTTKEYNGFSPREYKDYTDKVVYIQK